MHQFRFLTYRVCQTLNDLFFVLVMHKQLSFIIVIGLIPLFAQLKIPTLILSLLNGLFHIFVHAIESPSQVFVHFLKPFLGTTHLNNQILHLVFLCCILFIWALLVTLIDTTYCSQFPIAILLRSTVKTFILILPNMLLAFKFNYSLYITTIITFLSILFMKETYY